MSDRRPVTVMVATFQRVPFLGDCLAAIASQLGEDDQLVVAEGGTRAAAGVVAAVGRPVTHLEVRPPGKSRQLNAALGHVTTDVVLLTDDDCRIEPGWVDAMAAPFADPGVVAAVGPVVGLTAVPGSEPAAAVAPGPGPVATWTYAHGAALALRRSAVLAAGGFDERLGPGTGSPGGEDHDLLVRLRERGGAVVIADAPAVVHLDWRDDEASWANALAYERGAGAFLGAALRRRGVGAGTLLKHRLGYQWQLVTTPRQRRFGARAVLAFAGGVAYGLRLPAWPPGPAGGTRGGRRR